MNTAKNILSKHGSPCACLKTAGSDLRSLAGSYRGLLALMFFQAWVLSFFFSPVAPSVPSPRRDLVYATSLLFATAMLIYGFLARRNNIMGRRADAAIAACAAAPTLLIRLAGANGPVAVLLVASMLIGGSIGIFVPRIGGFLVSADPDRAAFSVFGAFLLVLVPCSVVRELPGTLEAIAVSAFPLCATGLLRSDQVGHADRPEAGGEGGTLLSSPKLAFFYIGVYLSGLVLGFCLLRSGNPNEALLDSVSPLMLALLALAAGAFGTATLLFRVRFDLRDFLALVFALVVIGLILLDRFPLLSFVLMNLGYQVFAMVVWVACSWVGARADLPRRAFCVIQACMIGGLLVGFAFNRLYSLNFAGSAVADSVSLAAAVLLISLASAILNSGRVNRAIKGSDESEKIGFMRAATKRRCAELGARYSLTAREQEVLGYLSQGRSLPYVEKRLYISHGTANAHRDHIYAKLGIHSKQELIDIFFGAE